MTNTDHINSTIASTGRRLMTYPLYNYSATLAGGMVVSSGAFIKKGPRLWYRGVQPSLPFGIVKEFSQLTCVKKVNSYVSDSSWWKPVCQTGVACAVDGFWAPVSAAVNEVRLGKSVSTLGALRENPRLFLPSENKAANIMVKGGVWWTVFSCVNHVLKRPDDRMINTVIKGGFAGLMSSSVCYPLDTVRFYSLRNTTYDKKAGSLIALTRTLYNNGKLYQGIVPCLLSGVLSAAVTAVVIAE